MKKVVLLGDSIRQIGYGTVINKYLPEDEYIIWQPKDNCRFVKNTLRMLVDYKNELKDADIIHWNNGLWDMAIPFEDGKPFTSLEEYKENILRVAKILLSYGKKVIFATTTPVKDKHPDNNNEVCELYNKEVVPLLKEQGIIINDLYYFVKENINEYISDVDYIHLTEIGKEEVAKKVADVIREISATI